MTPAVIAALKLAKNKANSEKTRTNNLISNPNTVDVNNINVSDNGIGNAINGISNFMNDDYKKRNAIGMISKVFGSK